MVEKYTNDLSSIGYGGTGTLYTFLEHFLSMRAPAHFFEWSNGQPPQISTKWNEVTKRMLVKLRNEVKQGSDSPPPNRDEVE